MEDRGRVPQQYIPETTCLSQRCKVAQEELPGIGRTEIEYMCRRFGAHGRRNQSQWLWSGVIVIFERAFWGNSHKREKRRAYDFKRIFSGFKSQWISLASFKIHKASRSWAVNTFTSCVLSPWNWFCFISSYKFDDKSSKTRHKWFLWMKESRKRRIWCSSWGSHCLLS